MRRGSKIKNIVERSPTLASSRLLRRGSQLAGRGRCLFQHLIPHRFNIQMLLPPQALQSFFGQNRPRLRVAGRPWSTPGWQSSCRGAGRPRSRSRARHPSPRRIYFMRLFSVSWSLLIYGYVLCFYKMGFFVMCDPSPRRIGPGCSRSPSWNRPRRRGPLKRPPTPLGSASPARTRCCQAWTSAGRSVRRPLKCKTPATAPPNS